MFYGSDLVLGGAALDDITTGQEPSLAMEYGMLILSVPILDLLAWTWRRSSSKAV